MRKRAQDTPVLPRPTISVLVLRLWAASPISPHLQGGQAHQHQDHGDDPETHDDAWLGPALELEMVMQRRHAEDALTGELERAHLQNHRYRLCYENATHDEQHYLLAHDHRERAERGAESQRAHVAHEHLGRVGVEP